MADCIIRSRIDSHIKIKATHLFEKMGLTMSDAIRIFLYQSVAEKRIPFSVRIPNAKTLAALQELSTDRLEKTSLKQLKEDWDEE